MELQILLLFVIKSDVIIFSSIAISLYDIILLLFVIIIYYFYRNNECTPIIFTDLLSKCFPKEANLQSSVLIFDVITRLNSIFVLILRNF